jgi:CubicO group peptidase (beta-lactamase class C family)
VEKQARVIDLLKARSGIYHAALYETPAMKAKKPARGSHPPRSFWSYNNWDFNALGTIYESATHDSIYRSFDERIARPIGMEDYRFGDQEYVTGPDSIHRAYPFRMTARDMARFGLLYLRDGRWRDQQVVPARTDGANPWLKRGACAPRISVNGNRNPKVGVPDGSFSAWGAGGHFIAIIPALQLVVVHRVDIDDPEKKVTLKQFGKLLRLILVARKSSSMP